jgi:pimeloyl-ACP methyl ester carboxylesterase
MSRQNHTPAMFVREPSSPIKGNIVFVHDAWHGAWCWDEYFTKDFSDRGFRCITFNLPGHGRLTDKSEMNGFGFDDYVDALASVVAHCDESPVIIGHGMGALVLQKYLQSHTCRMAIFMSPMPSNGYWGGLLRLLKNFGTWKALRNQDLFEVIKNPSTAASLLFTKQTEPSRANEWHSRLCGASYRAFKELTNLDIKPISPSLTPSIVIGGGKDKLISTKDFKRTSRIHDAGMIIIPHMGHDMMLDHGHAWLVDLMINCMDFPVEQEEMLPVVNKLRVASSPQRRSLEPTLI